MSEPAAVGKQRQQVGDDTARNGELAELRDLLWGPEQKRLIEFQQRIENAAFRTGIVAEVLPDAFLLRAGRDRKLKQVLQPIFEEAIITSVRKDPHILAEALFPIIGVAVRRAVASSLQGMVESLNQIVETSLSLRSIQWRIEAARTGKPYGEIALLRSLLYRVEQVFLIQKNTGLVMQHVIAESVVERDPEMVSGMLTAIQNFVNDSFGSGDDTLETMRVGNLSVWIQQGTDALIARVVRGTPPPQLRTVFASALETIQGEHRDLITSFEGNAATLTAVRPILQKCLLGQSANRRRTSLVPVFVFAGLILLTIAAWLVPSILQQRRWNAYVSSVRSEPGITVTQDAKEGSRFTMAGLRDPLARDPAELLPAVGISPENVSFSWEPYASLSPRFAAQREFDGLKKEIEQEIIRFDVGKSALTYAGSDLIEAVAPRVERLFQAAGTVGASPRLELLGRTDEIGTEESNARLGLERANEVKAALSAQGIPPDGLSVRSVGVTQPLRSGRTERDRSMNRSVVFRIVTSTN